MKSHRCVLLIGVGLSQWAFTQGVPKRDPLDPVTANIETNATPESRQAPAQLIARARNNTAVQRAGVPYHLKISFSVDSLGQTDYDGAWQMEDFFSPGQGLHWSAKSSAGYSITAINSTNKSYSDGTTNYLPLRLHEARGLLFAPLPSAAYVKGDSMRTATVDFRGTSLTCVLLSRSRNPANPNSGRGWEESEDCIDAHSGLLVVHSEVPGRYAVYDYSNGPQLSGHLLPRTVSVTEAGKVVSRISVETAEVIPLVDPNLFLPTQEMTSAPSPVTVTGATKILRVHSAGPITSNMVAQTVCVLGVVTSRGQLAEAHSLDPADPDSQAAIADARAIDFSPTIPQGGSPHQHFVFVIEKFFPPQ